MGINLRPKLPQPAEAAIIEPRRKVFSESDWDTDYYVALSQVTSLPPVDNGGGRETALRGGHSNERPVGIGSCVCVF